MKKNNLLKDFRVFIERGNAVDMAVGIIVGSVMTGVVNSLVKDILMPPIGLMIGGVDFSNMFVVLGGGVPGEKYLTLEAAQAAGATTINVGLFLNSVVGFVITMFAIFLFVRFMNKMRSKQPVTTRACPYCKSSINIAASKCPNCCSDVDPIEAGVVEESDLAKGVKDLKKMAAVRVSKVSKIAKKTIR